MSDLRLGAYAVKLISCYIEGFGKLSAVSVEFHDGCNTFVRENGWGKSTLAAFVRVMFFGFDGEAKRNDTENERRRYRPWAGCVYGGEVVFETEGRRYRLQRVFRARKGEDTFALYDAETNTLSRDFTENIGEELFGVDAVTFARTMYIGQNDAAAAATDDVNAKLGNVTDSTADMRDYETAMEGLKRVINGCSPRKKTGSIYRLKQELAEAERCAGEAQDIRHRIEALTVEQGRLAGRSRSGDEYGQVDRQIESLKEFFPGDVPNITDVDRYIEMARALEREDARCEAAELTQEERRLYDELAQEYESLGDGEDRETCVETYTYRRKSVVNLVCVTAIVLLGVASFFVAKSPALGSAPENFKTVLMLAAASCVILICGIICRVLFGGIRHLEGGVRAEALSEDVREFKSLQKKYEEFEKIAERADSMRMRLESIISEMGFEPQRDMLRQLQRIRVKAEEYDEAVERRRRLAAGRVGADGAADRLRQCDVELAGLRERLVLSEEAEVLAGELQERLNGELHRYELVTKTYELLESAKQKFAAKYSMPVMDSFSRYYECVSGSGADDFVLDANLDMSYRSHGLMRGVDTLSSGLADLTGVCMRLAFVDAMYKGEKPFLIMDDTFVNLDDDNIAGAAELMRAVAERYQVIYFTCSESRRMSDV